MKPTLALRTLLIRRALPSAISAFCLLYPSAHAATWDGGGADNSTLTANNWGNNTVPASSTSLILTFAGSTQTTITWNGINTNTVNLRGLTFAGGAGAFTINNGTKTNVQFVGGNGTTPLLNNSSNLQTLNILSSVFYNGIKTFDGGASGAGFALNGGIDLRFDSMSSGQTNTLNLTGAANSTTAFISETGTSAALNAVTKNGTGKWTVTGNATYTGATTISQGTMEFQGSVSSSSITNNAAVIFNSASAQSYGNTISGTGTLTKQGVGTLTLSGTQSYTGATTISAGTLEVRGSLSSSSITNNAALVFNSGSAQSYGNTISGNGSLTKQGVGTLTLSGANTYTGATTIDAGTLRVGTTSTANAISITNHSFESPVVTNFQYTPTGAGWTFATGSGIARNTFFVNTPPDGSQAGFLQSNTAGISQTINVSENGFYNIDFQAQGRGGTLGPNGIILQVNGNTLGSWADTEISQSQWLSYGSRIYLEAGSHTLAFLGNNTAGGDKSSSIDNVRMNQPIGSLSTNTAVNITSAGATLDLNYTNQTIRSLTGVAGTSVINGNLIIGGTDTTTFAGVISGAGGLSITGGGAQTLSGTNTYSGATVIKQGTLSISSTGSINSTSGVTIGVASTAGTSEFNFNSSTALTQAVSFAAGSTGGTLSGNGTINQTVTITAGNTLAIGNSIGQMNFGDALILAGTTVMEIDGTVGAGLAGGHDFANVTNALTYGGALILDLGTIFGTGSYTLNLFDFASETGTFTTITLTDQYTGSLLDADSDGIWDLTSGNNTWQFTESSGVLGLTVIPEPSVALLGGIGLLFLLRRRR